VLGVFNLIPIPPLDGSRILLGLLPRKLALLYAKITPMHGMLLLIVLLSLLRRIF
jgi:Zn-dependent protease